MNQLLSWKYIICHLQVIHLFFQHNSNNKSHVLVSSDLMGEFSTFGPFKILYLYKSCRI